ncbi:MAG: hypothetical protein MZV64_11870 [Ignavibacteriales bacterium]|nr:hypothetical protein [Ignavibacteriales bacterium]
MRQRRGHAAEDELGRRVGAGGEQPGHGRPDEDPVRRPGRRPGRPAPAGDRALEPPAPIPVGQGRRRLPDLDGVRRARAGRARRSGRASAAKPRLKRGVAFAPLSLGQPPAARTSRTGNPPGGRGPPGRRARGAGALRDQ